MCLFGGGAAGLAFQKLGMKELVCFVLSGIILKKNFSDIFVSYSLVLAFPKIYSPNR